MGLTKVSHTMITGTTVSASDFGAVNDTTYTLIPGENGGGIVSGGTDSTTAIQNAINAVSATGGGSVIIDGAFTITSTLTVGDNVTLLGTSSARGKAFTGTGPEIPAGLYISTDITMVQLNGTGLIKNLLLCGSGNYETGASRPDVIGTGVIPGTGGGGKSLENITFWNLRNGFFVDDSTVIVVVDFFNLTARYCDHVVEINPAATAANLLNFYGASFVQCDYGLINGGSISGEQTGFGFFGCHFEWMVRAIQGEFKNLVLYSCWFERISDVGFPVNRSNNDRVTLEPLAGSSYWSGSGNSFTSSANGILNVNGSSIVVEGYFTGTNDIRRVNFGSAGTTITDNSDDTTFFAQDKNQVHQNMWLGNPRFKTTDLIIDGILNPGVSDFYITSAINTPQVGSIGATSAGSTKGTLVTFVNNSGASFDFIDDYSGASAADRFQLVAGNLTLATSKCATFIYSGGRWLLFSTT
jgi:hypothetical protein